MVLIREYFPSDALKLINRSESMVVRAGVRSTTVKAGVKDKFGAHSVGRHLLKGAPGSLGGGVPFNQFKDRFLNSPGNLSSAWAGKGDMAISLCELLNSTIGQFALGKMEAGVGRVVVHYHNEGSLAGLFSGLAGSMQFHESRVNKTSVGAKSSQKTSSVTTSKIVAVVAVLDRFGSSLHLQTLFPSSDGSRSNASWLVGNVNVYAELTLSGRIHSQLTPVA